VRPLVLALGLWVCACTGRAETVQVVSGPNELAQGWLFLAADGRCKLLTAGHVVARDGAPAAAIVRDRHGRELETSGPEFFSLSPDIAVLPVRVDAPLSRCSSSRLSFIGVDRRAQQMKEGVIEKAGLSEIAKYRVVRTASRIDKGGGEFFAVRPVDEMVRFGKGWSGSIVLDDEGPVGVVFEAEEQEASVVRVDVLARLKPVAAAASTAEPPTRLTVLTGETVDPAQGPSGMMDARRPPWTVKPAQRRVEFTVGYSKARPLTGVAIVLDGTVPRIRSIDVAAGLRGGEFVSIRNCLASAPAASLSCRFAEQTREQMRVSIEVDSDDPLQIRNLRMD